MITEGCAYMFIATYYVIDLRYIIFKNIDYINNLKQNFIIY